MQGGILDLSVREFLSFQRKKKKKGSLLFREKGASRRHNVSIATKLPHFMFLFTLIVSF